MSENQKFGDRRHITAHEIFRDIISVSTLITIITTAVLIGMWIGKNDQKWEDQAMWNIEMKASHITLSNDVQVLKEWKVAKTQQNFNSDIIPVR
jgi:hypothetical protein